MDVLSIRITEQSVHRSCGAQAERLPCKATFSEEIALVQNAYRGFLPVLRHNGESYLSFLYIKNSIGRIALNEDRLLLGKSCDLPAAVDGRKECLDLLCRLLLEQKKSL